MISATRSDMLATICRIMSKTRQFEERAGPIVRSISIGFSSGYHWRLSGLDWGVLVWASRGVASVTIDANVWIILPHQALWVPAGVEHAVRMSGRGTLRQVYVSPSASRDFPGVPTVIVVEPLLREILRRVCAIGALHRGQRTQHRLFDMLRDEVFSAGPEMPAAIAAHARELPMPTDSRARRAADAVRACPARANSALAVAREAHASVRTLERLFLAETGLSFGVWRRRARTIHAMMLLADGLSVTATGMTTGYASTSAFVAAFKRDVGLTPGRYVSSTNRRVG